MTNSANELRVGSRVQDAETGEAGTVIGIANLRAGEVATADVRWDADYCNDVAVKFLQAI